MEDIFNNIMSVKRKKIILSTLIFVLILLTMSTSQAADFTDLNTTITNTPEGGTLNLTSNYSDNDTVIILIDKNITINGQGYTLNFNRTRSTIVVDVGSRVILRNLVLENHYDTDSDGTVLNHGELYLSNVIFRNNTVHIGGAIYNNGNVTIEDSGFYNNNASSTGGAIHNAGDVRIVNSIFNSNIGTFGGAINNLRTLILVESVLNNNTASLGGGSIYTNGYCRVEDCEFSFNHAVGNCDGGAIHNVGNVTIANSSFTNNTGLRGGSIYNSAGNAKIMDSLFKNNSAVSDSIYAGSDVGGGAIYTSGLLNASNCLFDNNYGYAGGAIEISVGTGNITSSVFVNNTSGTNGNSIYVISGYLNVSQSIIIGNRSIYSFMGECYANGNWWGNDTPVFTNLINNFKVDDYYRFLLTADPLSTYPNEKVNLVLVPVLNSTNETSWTGPDILTGDVVFTSTGKVNKKDNYSAVFSSSNIGNYTVTASSKYINRLSVLISVNKSSTSSVITLGKLSSVFYGSGFTFKVSLKSRAHAIAGQKVVVLYKNKVYRAGITDKNGMVSIKMPKLKVGSYLFTVRFEGNSNYRASNSVVRKVKVVPLKVTVSVPRNGREGYSQTKVIVINFNQKIKKSSGYGKIYMKNLNTKLRVTISKRIVGNKMYIKMKFKRYKRNYYRIYIPRFSIVNRYGKTMSKKKVLTFRT